MVEPSEGSVVALVGGAVVTVPDNEDGAVVEEVDVEGSGGVPVVPSPSVVPPSALLIVRSSPQATANAAKTKLQARIRTSSIYQKRLRAITSFWISLVPS